MSNHDGQSLELRMNHGIITFFTDLKCLAGQGNKNKTHFKRIIPATSVIIHKLIFFTCKFRHELRALWCLRRADFLTCYVH
jgi:hypothetical protein